LKPSFLQNIIGLTSGQQLPSPPPVATDRLLPPPSVPAQEALVNGFSRPPPNLPPPPHGVGSQFGPPPSHFSERGRGRPERRPSFQRHGHHYEQPHNFNPSYGQPPRRPGPPCRFWLEQGRCMKEDRCHFAHVPR
jgi:hypothetical protein